MSIQCVGCSDMFQYVPICSNILCSDEQFVDIEVLEASSRRDLGNFMEFPTFDSWLEASSSYCFMIFMEVRRVRRVSEAFWR